jgi:hypothetical protein
MSTMSEPDLEARISVLERRAKAFRICAVAWCAVSCLCFA